MTFTPDLRLRAAVVVDGDGSFRPGFHLPSLFTPVPFSLSCFYWRDGEEDSVSRQMVVERVVLTIFAKIK